MRIGKQKRHGTRWRQILVLAGAAMLLAGCADYFGKRAHLKDNPMDQAIATGDEFAHMKETRDRLLRRFPIGQPIAPIRRYLESVGAECRTSKGTGETATCRYSQYEDLVYRTPISQSLVTRSIYDFRIDLRHLRGLLRDVRVCRRITRIHHRGTFTDDIERIEYPMECLKGQDKKGK